MPPGQFVCQAGACCRACVETFMKLRQWPQCTKSYLQGTSSATWHVLQGMWIHPPLLLVFGGFLYTLDTVLAAELHVVPLGGGSLLVPSRLPQQRIARVQVQLVIIQGLTVFRLMPSFKFYKSEETIYLIPQAPLMTN